MHEAELEETQHDIDDELAKARTKREADKLEGSFDELEKQVAHHIRRASDQVTSSIEGDIQNFGDALLKKHGLEGDNLIIPIASGLLMNAALLTLEINEEEEFLFASLNQIAEVAGATLYFVSPEESSKLTDEDQRAMIIGRLVHHAFLEIFDRISRTRKPPQLEMEIRRAAHEISAFCIRLGWRTMRGLG